MGKASFLVSASVLLTTTIYAFEGVPDRSKLNELSMQKAANLVRQMTLEEKVDLIEMDSASVKRLNIPAHHWWNEALHGVARRGKATQFPVALSMASTWNPELIGTMADAISSEARALYHSDSAKEKTKIYHGLTIWSPVVNMARDPRWGRTEETYGEDPYLTGRIGVEFVKGIQGDHPDYLKAVATVKHFVANNTEYNRLSTRPDISDKILRDYYLKAFHTTITEARVESIMSAYNGINGVPCSVNKWLLSDLLRKEWGFKGTVVTDVNVPRWLLEEHKYYETGPAAAAGMIQAGVDLYSGEDKQWAAQAVAEGLLSESELDRAVTQSLATRIKLGLHREEGNPYSAIPESIVGSEKHLAIARQIAREGIILLKNERSNLPATPEKYKRIILAGPYANVAPLGGYSGIATQPAVTPIMGFKNVASGFELDNQFGGKWTIVPESNLHVPGDPATQGWKGEYFANQRVQGEPVHTRMDKTVNFLWKKPIGHVDPIIPQPAFSVRWNGVLTPNRTGNHTFSIEAVTGARVWINGTKILDIWQSKAERKAISKPILLTKGQPANIRVEYCDRPSSKWLGDASQEIWVKFKWIQPTNEVKKTDPSKDLLVYVGGITHEMASESHDIKNLSFPQDQLEEIATLVKKYPNMVVVVNGGTAVQLDQVSALVPSVLLQWFPGQEGGNALAEIITGKVNPSGRLPLTIYTDAQALPDFDDYDIRKGRTYMYATNNVTYPFGYGLGYTTFKYSNMGAKNLGKTIAVNVDVTNTGKVAGDDVVQVYVKRIDAKMPQAIKQLKAFKRVSVPVAQTTTVRLEISVDELQCWSEDENAFVVEAGKYEVEIGRSSADIQCSEIVSVK